jgi:very-short-patch-repair endonuclease
VEYDEKRTYWMAQEKGLRVVRYTNDEVMKHFDAVVENIADWCADVARPSPLSSPRGTGERE